jgi:hypothetical protein
MNVIYERATKTNAACIFGITVSNWLNPNKAPPLYLLKKQIKRLILVLRGKQSGTQKQFKAPAAGAWEAPS